MFDIVLKVVIITGGANGIGSETVKNFLYEGAKFVAFIDIDRNAGNALECELKHKYGADRVKFFHGDVTRDEDLATIFNYTITNQGYVDVVVNNAGIANDASYKREIDVNFKALVTCTLKALDVMRKDKCGKGGTIINISSNLAIGLQEQPTIYVYSATKSAVLLFTNNLGMKSYYSYTGVRAITMCYGLTNTNILVNLTGIDDISTNSIRETIKNQPKQSATKAAEGLIEAYKKGETGSTWFANDSKTIEITDRVRKAYKIMSGEIEL